MEFLIQKFVEYQRLCRFIATGVIATGSHFILIYVMTDLLGIWYVISVTVGFITATLISFFLQKFWTFENHDRSVMHKQGSIFFIVAGISMVVNTYIDYTLVEFAGFHYILAQLVASAIIAVSNYIIYKRFIFKAA